jgi:subtilase family serine protease
VKWKYANDAYYVNFGTLAEKISSQAQPDLVITDIGPNATTLRPNKNYKINATVKNTGGKNVTATFNLSLSVNGSYYNKTSVTGGLDMGESKTVSFARLVNLPKGCHTFKVVADSDDDVSSESDETNNATTEYYQFGYVLVVEGNGDFDDLVTESENGAFGDGNVSKVGTTYYIQNFTGDYAIELSRTARFITAPMRVRQGTPQGYAWTTSRRER